jgi:hypothetical protein
MDLLDMLKQLYNIYFVLNKYISFQQYTVDLSILSMTTDLYIKSELFVMYDNFQNLIYINII